MTAESLLLVLGFFWYGLAFGLVLGGLWALVAWVSGAFPRRNVRDMSALLFLASIAMTLVGTATVRVQ